MFLFTDDISVALFWNKEFVFTSGLIASTFLHFAIVFTGQKLSTFKRAILYLPSSLIFVGVALNGVLIREIIVWDWGKESILGWAYPYFGFYFFTYIVLAMYEIFKVFIKAKGHFKTQLLYVLSATIITSIVGTYFNLYLVLIGNYRFIWAGPFNSFFLVTIIAFAILRHQLMDIEVIIRKGIIYSTLVVAVVSIFTSIIMLGQAVFQQMTGYNPLITSAFAAVIIAFIYDPIKNFITNATDKIFFRKKYDYQKVLREISTAMAHLSNVDRLVDLITRIVTRSMRLEGACGLILDHQFDRYIVKAATKKATDLMGVAISSNYNIVVEMRENNHILVRDELEHMARTENLAEEEKHHYEGMVAEMKKLHAAACVPTFSKGKHFGRKLLGFLCLGEKLSQDMYTPEDVDLLATLSSQASIALENALLYDEQIKTFQTLTRNEKMAALGNMAAGVVHELKNPLTYMATVAQMLPSKAGDADFMKEVSEMMPSEVSRMRGIVDSLLEFSRQREVKFEPVDLNNMFEKILKMQSFELRKHEVNIIKKYSAASVKAQGDSNHLMQVFMNLINNGMQAMPKGGDITLEVLDREARVAVKVSDTGLGIPQKQLKEIFNPFFSTKETGTGLGLAITQKIIEEHKGQIEVESEVGKGTTFTVYLQKAT